MYAALSSELDDCRIAVDHLASRWGYAVDHVALYKLPRRRIAGEQWDVYVHLAEVAIVILVCLRDLCSSNSCEVLIFDDSH